jgi:hypothetical protein
VASPAKKQPAVPVRAEQGLAVFGRRTNGIEGIGAKRKRVLPPAADLTADGVGNAAAEHRPQRLHGRCGGGAVIQRLNPFGHGSGVEADKNRLPGAWHAVQPLAPQTFVRGKIPEPIHLCGPEHALKAQPALVQQTHLKPVDGALTRPCQWLCKPHRAGFQHPQRQGHDSAGGKMLPCRCGDLHPVAMWRNRRHHFVQADVEALGLIGDQRVIAFIKDEIPTRKIVDVVIVPGGKSAPVAAVVVFDLGVDRQTQQAARGRGHIDPFGQSLGGLLQRDVMIKPPRLRLGVVDQALGFCRHRQKINGLAGIVIRNGPVITRAGACGPNAVGKRTQRVASGPVQPACPHIQRQIGPQARGPGPPADAVTRLKYDNSRARNGQMPGGGQSRHPGTQDEGFPAFGRAF